MDRLSFKKRMFVLERTLILEKSSSDLIKILTGLEDKKDSRTLDNKSSSFSLRNKIDLLHDLEFIDRYEYSEFLLIMSIRNQFMHNYDCNRFTDVIKFIDGCEKRLLESDVFGDLEPDKTKENQLADGFIWITDRLALSLETSILSEVPLEHSKAVAARLEVKKIFSKMVENYVGIIKDEKLKKHLVKNLEQILDEEQKNQIDKPTLDERITVRMKKVFEDYNIRNN